VRRRWELARWTARAERQRLGAKERRRKELVPGRELDPAPPGGGLRWRRRRTSHRLRRYLSSSADQQAASATTSHRVSAAPAVTRRSSHVERCRNLRVHTGATHVLAPVESTDGGTRHDDAIQRKSGSHALRTTTIDGVDVFYREAGDPSKPTIVLLHGFPSSSHSFHDLIRVWRVGFMSSRRLPRMGTAMRGPDRPATDLRRRGQGHRRVHRPARARARHLVHARPRRSDRNAHRDAHPERIAGLIFRTRHVSGGWNPRS